MSRLIDWIKGPPPRKEICTYQELTGSVDDFDTRIHLGALFEIHRLNESARITADDCEVLIRYIRSLQINQRTDENDSKSNPAPAT